MIRFGLKLLAFPLFFIFSLIYILLELLINVYSLSMGIVMNIVIICIICAAFMQQWFNFGLFFGLLVAIAVLTFFIGTIASIVSIWRDDLHSFIFGWKTIFIVDGSKLWKCKSISHLENGYAYVCPIHALSMPHGCPITALDK